MADALEFAGMLVMAAAVVVLGLAGFALLLFLWVGFMAGPLWLLLWIFA